MYAQDNNSLPVWIILSPAHHHISTNSQPFLVLCTHKTTILCQFGLFCHQLTTISPPILNHFWWELYHDDNTSLAGVQGNNASLAEVPMPVMTNDNDNDSDAESDHDSIDPNKADNNSSKASVHSTGSHILVHSMTDEPWRTRKSWTSYIYPSWKPKFLYYVDLEEFR